MTTKVLELSIVMSLIFFISCKDDSTTKTTESNIFNTQENLINHLKLEISSTDSWLVHNETLTFTTDSIIVTLKIAGIKEGAGTGDVHLYSGVSTTFAAYSFNRDTLITDTLKTDTLIYKAPDRATFTFRNFTGTMNYQMDGL